MSLNNFFSLLEHQSDGCDVPPSTPDSSGTSKNAPFAYGASPLMTEAFRSAHPERRNRLINCVNQTAATCGVAAPSATIPPNLLLQLVRRGALEPNDALQDRWVHLLVNIARGISYSEPRRAFVSILDDLSELDILLLEIIYSRTSFWKDESELWTTYLPLYVTDRQPDSQAYRPAPHIELSLENLARLGLVASAMAYGGFADLCCIHRTILGRDFLKSISSQSG
jgi:hypothetical protein